MAEAATMIDPLLPPRSAERLAALRPSVAPTAKRRKPAQSSKITAAGISTTALLAMVAAMGWSSTVTTAQSAVPEVPVADGLLSADGAAVDTSIAAPIAVAPALTTAAPLPVVAAAPVPAITVAPLVPVAPVETLAPEPVPTDAPVAAPIPVAVPAPKPVVKKKKRVVAPPATKTSG
jgi:L-fucose mutarotase/ribose pyranase (RbsD/FucU family)